MFASFSEEPLKDDAEFEVVMEEEEEREKEEEEEVADRGKEVERGGGGRGGREMALLVACVYTCVCVPAAVDLVSRKRRAPPSEPEGSAIKKHKAGDTAVQL